MEREAMNYIFAYLEILLAGILIYIGYEAPWPLPLFAFALLPVPLVMAYEMIKNK